MGGPPRRSGPPKPNSRRPLPPPPPASGPNPGPGPRPRKSSGPPRLPPSGPDPGPNPRCGPNCCGGPVNRARASTSSSSAGGAPLLEITRPSRITATIGTRSSCWRKNCAISSLGLVARAALNSSATTRVADGEGGPYCTREVSHTSAPACTATTRARNSTKPRPMRQ